MSTVYKLWDPQPPEALRVCAGLNRGSFAIMKTMVKLETKAEDEPTNAA